MIRNPIVAALSFGLAFHLIAGGLVVAWVARPFDGAHLILAPALILAGAAILVRFHVVSGRTPR
ncbi:hypothetical protein JN535_08405 [Cellulosimicrobium cellulans]|uniref:hypothetical protein n=1 Tax=Cellulosimicrobium cellulans TaxID=1710 RepID=UPI0019652F46|nr:hypothetical protein [Cellulosimicrobium cellulans]MBN0040186.1 hypothetical protein [Cellulosimicrobium cellulans]